MFDIFEEQERTVHHPSACSNSESVVTLKSVFVFEYIKSRKSSPSKLLEKILADTKQYTTVTSGFNKCVETIDIGYNL